MKREKMHIGVLIILLAAVVFIVCPAYALTDELNLTGTVTAVDSMRKTVTVDVASSSCSGSRTFSVDNVQVFEALLNERIKFFIDSFVCRDGEVYKILSHGRT